MNPICDLRFAICKEKSCRQAAKPAVRVLKMPTTRSADCQSVVWQIVNLTTSRRYSRLTIGATLISARLLAADPSAAQLEFFENHIRPVLAENCYKCHSQQAEKVKGGLLLDTREGVLKGGDTGPAILPGEPEKSLLIKAIRYGDENLQMPPKGKKLAPDQIEALEAWVKMGAPSPVAGPADSRAETIAAKARTHWAFQPIHQP